MAAQQFYPDSTWLPQPTEALRGGRCPSPTKQCNARPESADDAGWRGAISRLAASRDGGPGMARQRAGRPAEGEHDRRLASPISGRCAPRGDPVGPVARSAFSGGTGRGGGSPSHQRRAAALHQGGRAEMALGDFERARERLPIGGARLPQSRLFHRRVRPRCWAALLSDPAGCRQVLAPGRLAGPARCRATLTPILPDELRLSPRRSSRGAAKGSGQRGSTTR